ncbi:MAG: hypothetical protein C9356_16805 [Oleiphilus sp.]|nr:MAG: hypothetical protein C9356_16805 [Oleiphilus sp.]
MSLHYQIIPVTPFEQNCSVLWCAQSKEAAVVDPGGDMERILKVVVDNDLTLTQILMTHAHIDHAGATADLAELKKIPIVGPHREDDFWIQMLPQQSQMFGFPAARKFSPDRWLEHGDEVHIGKCSMKVLHCPGHTPGHVVFFAPDSRLAIVGDVLFQGSIGRTDFPMGDHATLLQSIRQHLWPLGDDVAFIPGHGPMSTIGQEIKTNPFVAGYG